MSEHELISSAVLAWMASKGIQMVKGSKLMPFITMETDRLNKWIARIIAAVAAFGIHFSFDPNAGVLTIAGLTWTGIGGAILEYARQFMLQEIAYKKFIKAEL